MYCIDASFQEDPGCFFKGRLLEEVGEGESLDAGSIGTSGLPLPQGQNMVEACWTYLKCVSSVPLLLIVKQLHGSVIERQK